MAKSKIDAFESKITNTYLGIQNLINKNPQYEKQRDYSQLMITASSTFADISDILVDLPKKIKDSKITECYDNYIKAGIEESVAKDAARALFGQKQMSKSLCENVYCPYAKETIGLIIKDGYVDLGKVENAIEANNQNFDLSSELNKEIKSMEKKNGFIYKLFHKSDSINKPVMENNNAVNNKKIERVQITVKEAMNNTAKDNKDIFKSEGIQKTNEKEKANDGLSKR